MTQIDLFGQSKPTRQAPQKPADSKVKNPESKPPKPRKPAPESGSARTARPRLEDDDSVRSGFEDWDPNAQDPEADRLPVLAAEIKRAHAGVEDAAKTAAERAIEAGAALLEAKALVKHGQWLPWLSGLDSL
jgi:hypothetical protein